MPKYYWEDFVPGSVEEYGPRLVTREEIIAFAASYDPQPMHLDEEAARATLLGGLSASGWHSCAIMMRMVAEGFVLNSSCMGSPGIDEVKWRKPVRPGDKLKLRRTVLDARGSNSRPDRGFVRFRFELINQDSECVMEEICSIMFGRRPAAA